MMSLTIFSQNTKEVKVTTLKNIYKDIRKCDSLKVAYTDKSYQLNNLINTNLTMFSSLEIERKKRLEYEVSLQKANKYLRKASKKQNGLFYGVIGVSIGVIVGVLVK